MPKIVMEIKLLYFILYRQERKKRMDKTFIAMPNNITLRDFL